MKRYVWTLAAAFIAFGGFFSGSAPAHSQALELELGKNGPKLRLRENCDPDVERCGDYGRNGFRDEDRNSRRFCTDDRALDKAERIGIRRAHIVAAGRRVVEIAGRDRYGDRTEVTIGRDRSCPVLD